MRETINGEIERVNRLRESREAAGEGGPGENPYLELQRELRGSLAEVEFLAAHAHEYNPAGRCFYCGAARPGPPPRPRLVPPPGAKAEAG